MGFVRFLLLGAMGLAGVFAGCSSVTDAGTIELSTPSNPSVKSSGSNAVSSSSSDAKSSAGAAAEIKMDSLIKMVEIPEAKMSRDNGAVFSTKTFRISATEVTRSLYKKVMGTLPEMRETGDSVAVANVNWYDAALFCNQLSKMLSLDTAYVYQGVDDLRVLKNIEIDYSVNAVRLPTETEWEIAIRGSTSTAYYWGSEVASSYAYYAQSNGPAKVAQFKPNEFGLYDMAGNVAEWVNDWFDAYSLMNEINPVGPAFGDYKVVRGGGWSDKASALASAERDKKMPDTQTEMIGFRIVHSTGF